MIFGSQAERERFHQELERREMMAESLRRERVALAGRIGDCQRVLGSQVGTLDDETRAALCAVIRDCKDRLEQLGRQFPSYQGGTITYCPIPERVR